MSFDGKEALINSFVVDFIIVRHKAIKYPDDRLSTTTTTKQRNAFDNFLETLEQSKKEMMFDFRIFIDYPNQTIDFSQIAFALFSNRSN